MKIKICGIRTWEAAGAAESGGADFLGFVFYPKSRRYLAPEQAASICRKLKKCKKVGVFVDEIPERVNGIAELAGLDYVQLHGHEDAAYAERIRFPIIKAWRFGDGFTADAANSYPSELVLLDSFVKGEAGGTGRTFAWREAAAEIGKLRKPLLLAGGISKENVKEAAELLKPYGMDVSGSLEENGSKSVKKIREFLSYIDSEGLR